MALFRKGKRSADIVADTDVDLLVIRNERLEWLILNRPEVTMEILKSLSDAVARDNDTTSVSAKGAMIPAGAALDALRPIIELLADSVRSQKEPPEEVLAAWRRLFEIVDPAEVEVP